MLAFDAPPTAIMRKLKRRKAVAMRLPLRPVALIGAEAEDERFDHAFKLWPANQQQRARDGDPARLASAIKQSESTPPRSRRSAGRTRTVSRLDRPLAQADENRFPRVVPRSAERSGGLASELIR